MPNGNISPGFLRRLWAGRHRKDRERHDDKLQRYGGNLDDRSAGTGEAEQRNQGRKRRSQGPAVKTGAANSK